MSARHIRVWDWPVRLVHWALVVCVGGLYATGEYGLLTMQWHFWFGYAALVLVLFRILWGLVGSEHARFADFVRGPRTILDYLRGRVPAPAGHNPLGALAVLAMLALLLAQALSGLFSNDEIEWYGPLSERISSQASEDWSDWHGTGQKLLLALIALHLVAIAGYRLLRKQDLVTPMLHGRKTLEGGSDARFASPWLALALFLACAVAVSLLVWWGPPAAGY